MATRETPFQLELVKSFEEREFHAFKASHREKTGVVDIYCRAPGGAVWIECKWMNIAPNFGTEKVSLTRPQWVFLRNEKAAGGTVATIIGYRRETSGHDVHGLFICNPEFEHNQTMRAWADDLEHPAHIIKARGAEWPAERIINCIIDTQDQVVPYIHEGRGE